MPRAHRNTRIATAVAAGAALLAAGVAAGYVLRSETEDGSGDEAARTVAGPTVTETETVTATTTVESAPAEDPAARGLPPAVAETRLAILAAVGNRSFDDLSALIPSDGFTYTYGSPHPDGPVAYWQELEETTDEEPFRVLEGVLELAYTRAGGDYVWPFAYDRDPASLTSQEKEALAAAGAATVEQLDEMAEFGSYLGWRAGIRADGTWLFFVAGD